LPEPLRLKQFRESARNLSHAMPKNTAEPTNYLEQSTNA